MPRVVLYIATSLDGFIADREGGVDWLFTAGDYGYADFLASVEAIVMGRASYDQMPAFGPWPYADKRVYVFTHAPPAEPHAPVTFVSGDPTPLVEDLRRTCTGDVWLFGGGLLASSFREHGLIDEYRLFVHPVLLGEGIPLFPGAPPRTWLRLEEARPWPDGLLELRYVSAAP